VSVPRPEHPRPQFVRRDWLNLNGEWRFEIDGHDRGLERGLLERAPRGRIIVPFCPESELSGVGNTGFMPAVWYQRAVTVPAAWDDRRVLLRFQAVDYDTTVWIDGVEAGRHRGGFTPFSVELPAARVGRTVIVTVRARDDPGRLQPRGKQSPRPENFSVFYTRTTGIWQTVWMEAVPAAALGRPRLTPDLSSRAIHVTQPLDLVPGGPARRDLAVRATLSDGEGMVCEAIATASADMAPQLSLTVPAPRWRPWSPADPHLYGLRIDLLERDRVIDHLDCYAGARAVAVDGAAVRINGRPVFQRLVLDQGYYPDGVMTAPSDETLRRDIELSLAAGFNGARLHQKVFEERFLYHADRLGYLCWGEFADWGCSTGGPPDDRQRPDATYVTQWLEALERDYSHPSIVGWCPLNETGQALGDRVTQLDDVTRGMFLATRALDPTRPVLDVSGYSHRVPESDVYDCHDYEQDVAVFSKHHAGLGEGRPFVNTGRDGPMSVSYGGQPFFVSEFGGAWWSANEPAPSGGSWGYGERPRSRDEFHTRFAGLCETLLGNPRMFGYCYTQLTDVHQERNGIYTFDRRPKFDLERLRSVQRRRAAIEAETTG
jgi:beta-galactosidase/beta-glucuronidase